MIGTRDPATPLYPVEKTIPTETAATSARPTPTKSADHLPIEVPKEKILSAAPLLQLKDILKPDIGKKIDDVLAATVFDMTKVKPTNITGTQEQRAIQIEQQYNKNIKPDYSAFGNKFTNVRGQLLNQGELYLGSCNGIPEIRVFQPNKFFVAAKYATIGYGTTELERHQINEPLIGMNGSYIVNVLPGQYAFALGTPDKDGNTLQIFGTGTHVIHDPNFKFNPKTDVANQSQLYINPGLIMHIIRVPPGKMAKVMINNKPRLLMPQENAYIFIDTNFKKFDPSQDYVDISSNYIQHGQIHIIRVPIGKVAKVTINGAPHILPSRNEPYVFDDATFRPFDPSADYCDINSNYIRHGQIHIIRVPTSRVAKVTVNNVPQILPASDEPYVFNDATFSPFDPKADYCDVYSNYIRHGQIHIIRVPAGKMAKITINGMQDLLEPREEPYYYSDPNFQVFDPKTDYCNINDNYIKHGNRMIVRVPAGWVLKILDHGKPKLLEHQEDAYKYNDPNVYLAVEANYTKSIVNATEHLIEHGSLKRVMPQTGEKALVYRGGVLEVLSPSKKAVTFEEADIKIGSFIPDAVQNICIPTEKDKWLKVSTADSMQIDIQLAVAYQVVSPIKALPELGEMKAIETHIVNQAIAFMTLSIKQHSSQDFLRNNKRPEADNTEKSKDLLTGAADQQEHVFKQLKITMEKYGIEITQFSIEKFDYPDKELNKEMGQQSLVSARTAGEISVLTQKNALKQAEARQIADTANIALDQANKALISKAEAVLQESQLKAQATTTSAKAEGEAKGLILTTVAKATQEAKTTEIQGNLELQKQHSAINRAQAEREADTKDIVQIRENDRRLKTIQIELEIARIALEKKKVEIEIEKLEAQTIKIKGDAVAHVEGAKYMALGEALTKHPNLLPYLATKEMAFATAKANLNVTTLDYPQLIAPFGMGTNPSLMFNQGRSTVPPIRVLESQAEVAQVPQIKKS